MPKSIRYASTDFTGPIRPACSLSARPCAFAAEGQKRQVITKARKVFMFPPVESEVLSRLFVMNLRLRAQFGGFLFGRRVAQKIAAADFGTGQVLQQVRTAQRRMKLDVEMEPAVIVHVGRRLVQQHHIGERRPPQVVELHQKAFERSGEIAQFGLAERRDARVRGFRRDEDLVSIAREVGQENYCRFIFENYAPPVFALGLEDVLEEYPPGLGQMSSGDSILGLDGLEYEVGRVDLTMWVRVGDADDLALILEDQDVVDLLVAAEFDVLPLPGAHQVDDLRGLEFCEGQVVARAVAYDAGVASRGAIAINARRRGQVPRRVETHAGMIVVKDEDVFVIVVAIAAHASVARAQVTIGQIVRQCRLFPLDRLAVPRAVLPVRGDDDPLLAQRMPSFFPDHKLQLCAVKGSKKGRDNKKKENTFFPFFLAPRLLTPLFI